MAYCPFTRDGYTFEGWTDKADGSGNVYRPGDDVLDLAEVGETVTLYARWKKDIPKTGDENTPLLWTGLMLTAGAGLVLTCVIRRKKRER